MIGTSEDHLFFLLGFCFILVHEMDAIRLKEWRILPLFSRADLLTC